MTHSFLGTLVLLGAAGCMTGSSEPPATDASQASNTSIDAAAATDGGMIDGTLLIDAPPAAACTNAAYDPCTSNTQCTSGQCRAFGSAGFQVCTQACSVSAPCPTQNGAAVPCNNMGLCRPTVANTCTRT